MGLMARLCPAPAGSNSVMSGPRNRHFVFGSIVFWLELSDLDWLGPAWPASLWLSHPFSDVINLTAVEDDVIERALVELAQGGSAAR
jgi:hypothetical protein